MSKAQRQAHRNYKAAGELRDLAATILDRSSPARSAWIAQAQRLESEADALLT